MKTTYSTPVIVEGQLTEFDETQNLKYAFRSSEFETLIREEAKRRGLVLYFYDYAGHKKATIIDPTPREYKDMDYSKIDDFYDWCHENHLLKAEETDRWNRQNYGHKYRQTFSSKGDKKVDEDWRGNKTIWLAPDKDAWYHYSDCWTFYMRDPHATMSSESARELLQEYFDKAGDKIVVKVQIGRFNYESPDTSVERIVVYDGSGSRGSLDYVIAYDYAVVYPESGEVIFKNINGYDKEIKGEFNVILKAS